jgi:hypothetical protein
MDKFARILWGLVILVALVLFGWFLWLVVSGFKRIADTGADFKTAITGAWKGAGASILSAGSNAGAVVMGAGSKINAGVLPPEVTPQGQVWQPSLGTKIWGWIHGDSNPSVTAPTPIGKNPPLPSSQGLVNQQLGSAQTPVNVGPFDTRLLTPSNQAPGVFTDQTTKTSVMGPASNELPDPGAVVPPPVYTIVPKMIPDASADPWLGSGSFMDIVNQTDSNTLLH